MSNQHVRVVARFSAKPESVDAAKQILSALVEPTRGENGCIIYELLHNLQDPTDFTFVEEWESQAALDRHAATDHIKQCREQIRDHVVRPADIRVYELIR